MTTDFAGGDIGDRSTFSNSSQPMTSPEEVLSIEARVAQNVAEMYPHPDFLYETQRKLSMQFAIKTQEYILTESAKLGINPYVVAEQNGLIDKLKSELAKREATLQSILAKCKEEAYAGVGDDDWTHGNEYGYNRHASEVRALIEKGVR